MQYLLHTPASEHQWSAARIRTVRGHSPSIGLVSTYPPTKCGLATFTAALRAAIAGGRGTDSDLDVVSLVDERSAAPRPEVAYQHIVGDAASLRCAVAILNAHDAVLLQHEYGIYGGPDGAEVLSLISQLDVPAVVALHTVLSHPSPSQRRILEQIVEGSDRAIVMSSTGLGLLASRYDVDVSKARVVAHGANPQLVTPRPWHRGRRPLVLTWGLIGPGKGLRTAIEAFAALTDLEDPPRYRIVGRTHPKVRAMQGDGYLSDMSTYAHFLGLDHVVQFDTRYLDTGTLIAHIRAADIVLLPYDSTEQVTSGVLVEAVAAGKPVVATAFPHALELLGTGAGIVVPHSDPGAMAAALRRVLTDPGQAARMAAAARRIGGGLLWPAVAAEYDSIVAELVAERSVTAEPIAPLRIDSLAKAG